MFRFVKITFLVLSWHRAQTLITTKQSYASFKKSLDLIQLNISKMPEFFYLVIYFVGGVCPPCTGYDVCPPYTGYD